MQDLSNCILALGRLRVCPMPDWTSAFLEASTPLLRRAAPGELCACAKGLALLRVAPPEEWWRAFEAATAPLIASGRFAPQGLSDVLAAVALSLSGRPPSEEWSHSWMSEADRQIASFDPRSLSKAIWAAGKLRLQAPVPLKRRIAAAACSPGVLQQLPAEDLARLPWALVRLYLLPGQELADCLALHLCRRTGELNGKQLLRAAWALPRLRTAPGRGLMKAFAEAAEGRAAALALDQDDLPQAAELRRRLTELRLGPPGEGDGDSLRTASECADEQGGTPGDAGQGGRGGCSGRGSGGGGGGLAAGSSGSSAAAGELHGRLQVQPQPLPVHVRARVVTA